MITHQETQTKRHDSFFLPKWLFSIRFRETSSLQLHRTFIHREDALSVWTISENLRSWNDSLFVAPLLVLPLPLFTTTVSLLFWFYPMLGLQCLTFASHRINLQSKNFQKDPTVLLSNSYSLSMNSFSNAVSILSAMVRGVHLGHRISFELDVSGRFEIGFCIYIVFNIIANHFWSWVKSDSVTRSGKLRVIGSVLNTSKSMVQSKERLMIVESFIHKLLKRCVGLMGRKVIVDALVMFFLSLHTSVLCHH